MSETIFQNPSKECKEEKLLETPQALQQLLEQVDVSQSTKSAKLWAFLDCVDQDFFNNETQKQVVYNYIMEHPKFIHNMYHRDSVKNLLLSPEFIEYEKDLREKNGFGLSEEPKNLLQDPDNMIQEKSEAWFFNVNFLKKLFSRESVKNNQNMITNINDRWDVNTIQNMVSTLENDTVDDLIQAYEIAYNKEMQWVGKAGKEFIQQNAYQWSRIFQDILGDIIPKEKASSFVAIAWIESNGKLEARSEVGALGIFQIMPESWQEIIDIHNLWYTWDIETILLDPEKSAVIAAYHLRDDMLNLKNSYPEISDDELIINAVRKYNGWWISKLKPEYYEDTTESFSLIVDWLLAAKNTTNIDVLRQKLWGIQNTYFNNHTFPPLDTNKAGNYTNIAQIHDWIDRYLNKIVKQQYMYAPQFIAASNILNTQPNIQIAMN